MRCLRASISCRRSIVVKAGFTQGDGGQGDDGTSPPGAGSAAWEEGVGFVVMRVVRLGGQGRELPGTRSHRYCLPSAAVLPLPMALSLRSLACRRALQGFS